MSGPDETGFDFSGLPELIAAGRKEREQRIASVVRWQAEALVELLDQHVEDALIIQRLVRPGLREKSRQYLACILECFGITAAQHAHHRDLEMAQRRELALQRAAAIFERPHAVLNGFFQSSSSDNSDTPNANPDQPGGASSK